MAMRRRRSRDPGTVFYSEADGYWYARITYRAADGTKKRKQYKKHTEREALAARKAFLAKLDAGKLAKIPTLAQWSDWVTATIWMGDAGGRIEGKTLQNYQSALKLHVMPKIGHLPIDQIDPVLITGVIAGIKAPSAKDRARVVLSALLSRAAKMRLIDWNPVSAVDRLPPMKRKVHLLTARERMRLIHSAKGSPIYAAVVLGLAFGLRRGEAVARMVGDLDSKALRMKIQRSPTPWPLPETVRR